MCVYVCVCVSMFVYVYEYVYVYVYVFIYIYIYVYICVYMCIYVYIYIYIYIHIYKMTMTQALFGTDCCLASRPLDHDLFCNCFACPFLGWNKAVSIIAVSVSVWQACCSKPAPWKPCCCNPAVANLPLETLLLQTCCSTSAPGNLVEKPAMGLTTAA